jgi:hypothetical protein
MQLYGHMKPVNSLLADAYADEYLLGSSYRTVRGWHRYFLQKRSRDTSCNSRFQGIRHLHVFLFVSDAVDREVEN